VVSKVITELIVGPLIKIMKSVLRVINKRIKMKIKMKKIKMLRLPTQQILQVIQKPILPSYIVTTVSAINIPKIVVSRSYVILLKRVRAIQQIRRRKIATFYYGLWIIVILFP
jgi:hypothetical protein